MQCFVRDGGTIGAMTSIEKVLKCPVLFLGLSLPEHGYHAPNENFDWQQASGGMVAFAKYFEEIANLPLKKVAGKLLRGKTNRASLERLKVNTRV